MYPKQELTQLAAYKAALQQQIAIRRTCCAEAAAQVTRPFELLDAMLALWRRLSPLAQLATVPLGFLATRKVFPRLKVLGTLLRWGPIVYEAVRGIRTAVKTRVGSADFPHKQS